MSKQTTTTQPTSPILNQAISAALELRTAQASYDEAYNDIMARLEQTKQDVEKSHRYGTSMGDKAGNIVTALDRIAANMRLDLLVKYAAKVDEHTRALRIYTDHLLTEDEKAQVEKFLAI